ncbi:ThiF family adenylyltransferase [Salinisphaera japonica]|uniref:ThiF family adenylyltransferase n=1 Tax=Salinisphaera japonica TaxID=1304270 RepID=UPI003CCC887A
MDLPPCLTVKLDSYPFPTWPSGKPPKTLAELNDWIADHNPVDPESIWRELGSLIRPRKGKTSSAFMLLETRAGRFGAYIKVSSQLVSKFRPGAKFAKQLVGNTALTRSLPVQRWSFQRIDNDFVSTRNAPSGSAALVGKQIHLLGAGAIGAQLADFLVQAGAGRDKGSLDIYDPQSLRPENCGRHLLGIPSLGLSKAQALAARLKRERLADNVIAHVMCAGDPSAHHEADLVIDATGAPNIGACFSNYARRERDWALLSVAVEGEGWVASTHLYRGIPGEGCRTCLEPWVGGRGSHIASGDAPETRDGGCGDRYTPYRAAAASVAAGLASELACEWAAGRPTKLFRSIKMHSAPSHVRNSQGYTPKSRPTCICAS